jgi:lantibiotic leader peptide-processing serine protease
MPTEADGVIGVTSVGPSKRKAYYSDYGVEQADVSAPGGDAFDSPPARPENLILAAYPESVGRLEDRDGNGTPDIDANGNPTTTAVVKDGNAYYQWIQGTSMASPHATGVAALIVSEYGRPRSGAISLHPLFTQAYLEASATDTPCMSNQADGTFSYAFVNRPASFTSFCEGTPVFNGWYGHGIVDALRAVEIGHDINLN